MIKEYKEELIKNLVCTRLELKFIDLLCCLDSKLETLERKGSITDFNSFKNHFLELTYSIRKHLPILLKIYNNKDLFFYQFKINVSEIKEDEIEISEDLLNISEFILELDKIIFDKDGLDTNLYTFDIWYKNQWNNWIIERAFVTVEELFESFNFEIEIKNSPILLAEIEASELADLKEKRDQLEKELEKINTLIKEKEGN